ncbi:MATE family efflux transporter [Peptoniphilus sp. KCTC 25270]|uniref:MATE family efflux transporter n=1 Tax=Peptoniphilus sp. KCTC 25270 TaxID=2897414 RepID=UPI001E58A7F2|nr:MATE family efflux transporter [Peptoniphilus sp. KCTC 25270]MCD1147933.1 MATE family efflux transporter [Peptoniphilus sp. KCTC 25270]
MKRENVDLTSGIIWKALISFTIPLLLSALLQQFYNTVDLLIVGRFAGEADMAAIGATGPIVNMIIALFIGLSTGVSVLVAQFYSAGRRIELYQTVHTNFALAIYGGLGLTVFTYILTPLFLTWMKTPPEILPQAINYMRITFIGIIPVMVYNMGSGVLRSVGDSIRPFYFLVVSAVLNILLDLLFVAVWGMGAEGAAIATALAQAVSGVLIILSLSKTTDIYRLNVKKIKFHKDILMKIFGIGLPAGVQSALISFSNVIIQAQINLFGAAAIAGFAAAGRIDGFVFTALSAFGIAATTFSGQNIGMGKVERLKKGVLTSMIMVSSFMILISLIIAVFRIQLMSIFNGDPEVIRYGERMLLILSPTYVLVSIGETLGGFIRGSGKSLPVMIISLAGMLVVRLIWIFVAMPMYNSIDIIYFSYPISWVVSFVLSVIYFKWGRWRPDELSRSENIIEN